MADEKEILYDCAVIGGGLGGLCLSIQLAQQGRGVILFEKNVFPFHKVCGEYVSNESRGYLERLGLSLNEMNLPSIQRLRLSSPRGFTLEAPLRSGGFGISRFTLDAELCRLARLKGVVVKEQCKVSGVEEKNGIKIVQTQHGNFNAKMVAGAYGKHAPHFIIKKNNPEETNYVAVKYHVQADLEADVIELHNFEGGYCGISKVEEDRYCLCYLTDSKNLKSNNNSIKQMEEKVLYKNPHLRRYFSSAKFLYAEPLVISGITFEKRDTVSDTVFLLGDAAGTIAPLCGNGMSMAMRASFILTHLLERYYDGRLSYNELREEYHKQWNSLFSARIFAGRHLQKLFGRQNLSHHSLKFLSHTPGLLQLFIKQTHGKPF